MMPDDTQNKRIQLFLVTVEYTDLHTALSSDNSIHWTFSKGVETPISSSHKIRLQ